MLKWKKFKDDIMDGINAREAFLWMFVAGLVAFLVSPVFSVPLLRNIWNFHEYLALGIALGIAIHVTFNKHWIKKYNNKNLNRIASFVIAFVVSISGYVLGNSFVPLTWNYGYAILTHDEYCAIIGKSTTITVRGVTETIFPAIVAGQEPIALLPKDVRLPGLVYQVRSADIAANLASYEGQTVKISDIYKRRTKGYIPFFDLTEFPNPYRVQLNHPDCAEQN